MSVTEVTPQSLPPRNAEWEQILIALTDGKLSDGQKLRLAELIHNDDFRSQYVDHCALHGILVHEHGLLTAIAEEVHPVTKAPVGSQLGNRIRRAVLGITTAALALLVLINLNDNTTVEPDTPQLALDEANQPGDLDPVEASLPEGRKPAVDDGTFSLAAAEPRKPPMPETFLLIGSQNRPPAKAGAVVDKVRFNRDIRPILSDNCFACHGPDANSREAELRLDTEEGAFAKREDYGPAIVRFRADDSLLYQRIISHEEYEVMPPPETKKTLTEKQKNLVRRWIEEGAAWEDHWSFIAAAPVEPPAVDAEDEWVRNDIDRFTLAEMKRKGLTPNNEADRNTLIRRVTLDLTGLPPTPDEVRSFVNDDQPGAYGRLVDRLLASKNYGEHMGRHWLDVARYGDTHGLHLDNYREIWPYRDWVVNAYNENMPFDQFTVEQLAGDLLPDPTMDQLVATGFNRCNVTSNEGGSIPAELQHRNAVDRVETTATTFLGLTAGCSVCHDHKFDPMTQKEFFQLKAIFDNSTVHGMDGNVITHAPYIRVIPKDDRERFSNLKSREEKLADEIKAKQNALLNNQDRLRELAEAYREELLTPPVSTAMVLNVTAVNPLFDEKGDIIPVEAEMPSTAQPQQEEAGKPVQAQKPETGPVLVDQVAGRDIATQAEISLTRRNDRGAFTIGPKEQLTIPDVAAWSIRQPLALSLWAKPTARRENHLLSQRDKDSAGFDFQVFFHPYQRNNIHKLQFRIWDEQGHEYAVFSEYKLGLNKWSYLTLTWDGTSTVRFFVDGKFFGDGTITLADDAQGETSAPLTVGHANMHLSDIALHHAELSPLDALAMFRYQQTLDSFVKPVSKWTDKHDSVATSVLMLTDAEFATKENERYLASVDRTSIEYQSPFTLIMGEKKTPPKAFVLNRGEYDQPREEVGAAVPEFLPPLPDGAPANRLGLAKWLVDPSHPLTARVSVNRFWQQFFRTGLVKTSEDFGTQGEPPSHPELLDWLAVDFMEHGWDIKRFVKQLVMSATYRQSSVITPDKLAKDPSNRYLSHGPRYRLDAEVIRDQALAVSGLLVDRLGGPSVKPYQPPGIWKAVGYSSSNTVEFHQDEGDKIYRRSLYTFLKRTAPPPNMSTFDAPNREACTARRERTNTPMQALVLMNDPQFVEAARHLAEHMLHSPFSQDADRLNELYFRVACHDISDADMKVLQSSLNRFRELFSARPDAAKSLIEVGDSPTNYDLDPVEFASWTMVASQVLNLDEVINKN
ncbi:DUF1553 domain-containing protein [Calycomorphotria hydatis]|uniref:Planctomycete cytochrome C n=1 Tax=Calycomorphotria hydatis TaxID=2528027 RepID=A0A517T3B9_9PLAN|nr:DUF1553 domain-containing protein [Calycomorphotria hydatis]QDT62872.1 Planctomycete cytochrome C [Calycomorphotria hydatis]